MDGQSHCRGRARGSRHGHAVPAGGRLAGARPRAAKRRDGKAGNFAGGVHRLPGKSRNFSTEVSTDSPAPARAPSASACEPYRELIAAALGRGRNAVAIYQDLVDDHGFTAQVRERPPLRPASCAARRPPRRAS